MLITYLRMQTTACKGERDGVFLHRAFYNALTSGVLNVPQLSVLPGNDTHIPCVLVADDLAVSHSNTGQHHHTDISAQIRQGSGSNIITTQ